MLGSSHRTGAQQNHHLLWQHGNTGLQAAIVYTYSSLQGVVVAAAAGQGAFAVQLADQHSQLLILLLQTLQHAF
jgi:uncharacterized membrane protein YhfC